MAQRKKKEGFPFHRTKGCPGCVRPKVCWRVWKSGGSFPFTPRWNINSDYSPGFRTSEKHISVCRLPPFRLSSGHPWLVRSLSLSPVLAFSLCIPVQQLLLYWSWSHSILLHPDSDPWTNTTGVLRIHFLVLLFAQFFHISLNLDFPPCSKRESEREREGESVGGMDMVVLSPVFLLPTPSSSRQRSFWATLSWVGYCVEMGFVGYRFASSLAGKE